MHPSRAHQYGPEFEQLTLTAFRNLPFRLPLETVNKAKIMRARVYGYWRALREEDLRLDLVEMADTLAVGQEGSTLVFTLKVDSWEARAIRAALGLVEGFHENGNRGGKGELQVPDLLQNRLVKQLHTIRDRQNGSVAAVQQPFKN